MDRAPEGKRLTGRWRLGGFVAATTILWMVLSPVSAPARGSMGEQKAAADQGATSDKSPPFKQKTADRTRAEKRARQSWAAVVSAYLIVWAVLLAYLFLLHRRQRRLEADLRLLEDKLGTDRG